MDDKIIIQNKNGDSFEIDPKDYLHLKFSQNPIEIRKTRDELLIELANDFCMGNIGAEEGMQAFTLLVLPQVIATDAEMDYAKKCIIPLIPTEEGHCKSISREEAHDFFCKKIKRI
jgi:hypothetical protein